MQEKQWSAVALRIGSTVLSCLDITHTLETQPTSCRNMGEPISSRDPNSKKRTESVWTLESGLDNSELLEQHLEKLTNFVESKTEALNQLAAQSTITLFCGFSPTSTQSSFALSTELLKRMNLVPLEVVFDLYFSDFDSDD